MGDYASVAEDQDNWDETNDQVFDPIVLPNPVAGKVNNFTRSTIAERIEWMR
jgi:hypothetical protein